MKRSTIFYILTLIIGIIVGYLLRQYDLGAGLFAVVLGDKSQWFWAMTQTIIVLVSLYAIYQQVKLQSYSNMLDQLTNFRTVWRSAEMKAFRKAVCEEYNNKAETELMNAETELLNFFEAMGVLHKNHIVSTEFVWESYGYHLENFWPMLEVKVKAMRVSNKDNTFFENAESLWKALLKYSESRKVESAVKTPELLKKYVDQELKDFKDIAKENALDGY